MKTKDKLLEILLIIFIFLLIFIFYSVFKSINLDNLSFNILFYSLGKFCGLIGFLFLSILIFSGDTARFFDRFLGMDRIIKFQRKFALITSFFVIVHPLFFILSSRSYLNYLIPDFAVLPIALGTISLYIFIIIMICSALYKRISYQIWQYIHILTYILFFFSLYHATKIGSEASNTFVKLTFSILLIGIITGIIYRTYYKIKHRKFKCYVKEIRWETKDTFTLILNPNKRLNFKAGQFCFLRLNKDKLYARHPFTISNSPEDETLHFTIKLNGRFTKLASELKTGEEVIVDGPFGIFTLDNADKKKSLVFIAGGVGITPFYSIIKSCLHSDIKRNITLFYCSRTLKGTIFKKELDNIKEDWLKKVYIFSEEICQDYEKGYINKSIIAKHLKDINNSIFYICGPEKMKDCAIKDLKELGVKKENIIIEDFFW
jgi:predicted ferric reductase